MNVCCTAACTAGGLEGVRAAAMQYLRETFPNEDIPEPLSDLFYIRDNAWYYLAPGAYA